MGHAREANTERESGVIIGGAPAPEAQNSHYGRIGPGREAGGQRTIAGGAVGN